MKPIKGKYNEQQWEILHTAYIYWILLDREQQEFYKFVFELDDETIGKLHWVYQLSRYEFILLATDRDVMSYFFSIWHVRLKNGETTELNEGRNLSTSFFHKYRPVRLKIAWYTKDILTVCHGREILMAYSRRRRNSVTKAFLRSATLLNDRNCTVELVRLQGGTIAIRLAHRADSLHWPAPGEMFYVDTAVAYFDVTTFRPITPLYNLLRNRALPIASLKDFDRICQADDLDLCQCRCIMEHEQDLAKSQYKQLALTQIAADAQFTITPCAQVQLQPWPYSNQFQYDQNAFRIIIKQAKDYKSHTSILIEQLESGHAEVVEFHSYEGVCVTLKQLGPKDFLVFLQNSESSCYIRHLALNGQGLICDVTTPSRDIVKVLGDSNHCMFTDDLVLVSVVDGCPSCRAGLYSISSGRFIPKWNDGDDCYLVTDATGRARFATLLAEGITNAGRFYALIDTDTEQIIGPTYFTLLQRTLDFATVDEARTYLWQLDEQACQADSILESELRRQFKQGEANLLACLD